MKIGALIVVVVGVLAVGVIAFEKLNAPTGQTSSSATVQTSTPPTTADSAKMAAAFKDGKYESKGSYRSPNGPEEIDVKLTLKDNTITDAEVVSLASNPTSQQFQGKFISGYKQLVVGKKINEVQLDVVAGSSLTPKGFKDALQKIMTQAEAS